MSSVVMVTIINTVAAPVRIVTMVTKIKVLAPLGLGTKTTSLGLGTKLLH